MRIKVTVAATLCLLSLAAVADAHKVPVGYAKSEIRRATAELCSETSGCTNWSIAQCQRRSNHRVDCVATLVGETGVRCSFVVIARAPSNRYEVKIHHKRVSCS